MKKEEHYTWHPTTIHLQATGQHKNKAQSRPHTFSSILPICINTHDQYTTPVSKMYIQNIANIFVGFWIRACWILREICEN